MLYVDVGGVAPDLGKTSRAKALQKSNSSSNTASDDDQAGVEDSGSESEYVERDIHTSNRARTVQPQVSTSGPSTIVDWNKATTNMQIYGIRCPEAAFDVFAKCVISAWAAAPHPDDTSTKIREYALLRWRKVP